MKTVIIEVKSPEESFAEMRQSLKSGKPDTCARISFVSFELLWKVLTLNRWNVVQAMTGAGPLGIRELARKLGRDVSAVHADCAALVKAGVIDRTTQGKYLFPYDAVHVDFMLKAA